MAESDKRPEGQVLDRSKTELKKPSLFKVILHNDDYTTMEFVVHVLETVFNKPTEEAYRIMLKIHREGQDICGAYPYEIAETKVTVVHDLARRNGFPLRASMQEE